WPPDLLARVDAILDERPDLTALTTRVETVPRCDVDGGPVNRRTLFGRAVEFTMFLRRELVADLRYDEQMGVGAGTPWGADEGPDLMLRMLARGLTIEYFPDICIYHPDPALQPAERLLSRTMSYSRGRGYLYRKHGYSWLTVGNSLIRSLGGSILMLLSGRVTKARVYWRAFWGKLIGYVTAGKPPAQTVSSPLVAETRPA
ncbi:MAG: hypothetical protein SFU86_11970, partial [Pirellulaceae bacterium]|nr:hypothetical protein [Pirellulaceae bacterium]